MFPHRFLALLMATIAVTAVAIPFERAGAQSVPPSEQRPSPSIDWRRGFAQAGERLQQKILQGAIQSTLERSPSDEKREAISAEGTRAQGPGVAQRSPSSREFMEVVPVQSRDRRRRESAAPSRDTATDLGRGEEAQESDDGATEINVKNAELEAVIRIFSKKTKRNYILDEKVKGRVSIFLPGKISADESVRILDSVLALKGFTTVPIGDNLWKIVPAKEARQSTIPTLTESREGKPSASMVTRLVQLKYVSADDIKQVVTPLVSGDGLVNAYTGTNSLIVIDQEDNIERMLRIVESLDVPFSDREMTIIPVTYADATEIAQKLQEILGEPDAKGGQGGGESSIDLLRARLRETASAVRQSRSNASTSASAPESSSTVSARAREPKIIADQRTNSIIVVADEDMTSRIRALIAQLDSKVDLSGNRFYVYRCQHAKADELANVLAGLVGGGSGSTGSSSTTNRSGAFDDDTSSSSMLSRSSLSSRTSGGGIGAPSLSSQRSGGATRSATTVSLGENISVTADPATNSLIISAGKTDYMKLRALLEKLDVKRRQVLVEALLLEVGVDDTVSMGTEWMVSGGGLDGGVLARNNLGGLDKLLSDPVGLSGFSIAAASSGSLTLGDDVVVPAQTVLLSAAKQNQNVNVLSAPNVLATDNEQAEILVGQNVPFLASTSTSETNLNNTFNQVERQDVGITLRLTPQISSNDFVTLTIFTEVSNVILATLNSPLGPTTTKRASETTVITKDGQMVVIGGLMSDDVTTSENGVPFLEDVPVFGSLFRSSTDSRRRTNLLIFITPRIVKDQFDARDITIEDREQMERAIAELDAQPDRREHLRNRAVDEVAETANPENENADVEGAERSRPSLGTSTAPVTAPSASGSALPLTGTTVDVGGTEGVISLSVSPKLFEEPRAPVIRDNEPRARLDGTIPATGKFVVLRLDDVSAAQMNRGEVAPPFVASLVHDELPLHLPAGSQAAAYRFFEAGSRYSYRIGDTTLSFEAVGVFDSEEDGHALFTSAPPHWYTPSPFEVMAMAQGSSSSPWQRR